MFEFLNNQLLKELVASILVMCAHMHDQKRPQNSGLALDQELYRRHDFF